VAIAKQAALTKARERRVELHRDRAARDRRIETAAAEVFVRQAARAEAEQAIADADAKLGAALRLLLDDGVAVEGVAQLCDLTTSEVRRLTRTLGSTDRAKTDPSDKPASR
jgi:DNA-directed RNA polymerase specialized sigma24 family protein